MVYGISRLSGLFKRIGQSQNHPKKHYSKLVRYFQLNSSKKKSNGNCSLKSVTSKDMRKILTNNGWFLSRHSGPHFLFKKKGYRETVSVPGGNSGLKTGTIMQILRKSGLEKRDLMK